VIVSGLSIRPVRDRYKIFVIDEVHQLSLPSFNALLKSIEEPPPHVIFMMATTELEKIPETVLSRAQVYEFKTIGSRAIAEQLRRIVDAEGISAGDDSLQLIARDAEGSMRDAQSKLDQVIAFTGSTIAGEDVAAVLGLVGRDLLFDAVRGVADENAAAAFEVVGRAVELGYDLRAVCRELSRVVRDLMVLKVDPARIGDPEIAGETERERLKELAAKFSREDLLRAFDLLTAAEAEIRTAAQPRYNLEMALLRWIHLRKLVPIEDLIAGAESVPAARATPAKAVAPPAPQKAAGGQEAAPGSTRLADSGAAGAGASKSGNVRDAFLSEIRKSKVVFYNMVVAQAQGIEMAGDCVTFSFAPLQRALADTVEQNRAWLEALGQPLIGRRFTVAVVMKEGPGKAEAPRRAEGVGANAANGNSAGASDDRNRQAALRDRALADTSVQALLEVFPAEIRDVEEM
jgi:DNA polymerase-3 subunit gamma/tau